MPLEFVVDLKDLFSNLAACSLLSRAVKFVQHAWVEQSICRFKPWSDQVNTMEVEVSMKKNKRQW